TSYPSNSPDRPDNQALAIVNTTSFELTNDLTLRNIFGYIWAEGYTQDATDADAGPGRIIEGGIAHRPRLSQQYTNEVQLQGSALEKRLKFTVGGMIDLLRE